MRHRFDAGLDLSAARFFAAGISMVLHAQHPRVPTMHANFRYFERGAGATPRPGEIAIPLQGAYQPG